MLMINNRTNAKKRQKYENVETDKDEKDDLETDNDDIVCIKNSVYFYCDVTNKSVLKLIQKLHEATEHELKYSDAYSRKVYLYINSDGGNIFAGFSAMDHIRWNEVPVICVVDGFVASAATFLLLAGSERKAMQNSRILIHQLFASFWGKYNDLLDEVKNTQEIMKSVKKIYTANTYMSSHKVESLIQKELHMNAEEALKHGFVDEIW